MLLLVLSALTMPMPVGPAMPGDLGMVAALMGETRPSSTRVEVTVDPTGEPVRCDVVGSRGMGVLDRAACDQMMRRSRFRPARDALQTPVFAVVRQDFTVNQVAPLRAANGQASTARAVDFALPVAGLARPDPVPVADVAVMTDATGKVTSCDVAVSSSLASLDRLACSQMAQTVFRVARDRQGQAVAALRQVSVAFPSARFRNSRHRID